MSKKSPLQVVKGYVKELGWPNEDLAANLISLLYQGQFGDVKVMANVQGDVLSLAINPVLEKPAIGWESSVQKVIDTLNAQAHLIKVGVDQGGDLFVKVSLSCSTLRFEQFVYILLNLCRVADQLTVPVLQAQAYHTYHSVSAS